MTVRVVHKPPKGRDWPGFYFYGSDKLAFEFGFVCETIVSNWRDLRGSKLNVLPPSSND